MKLVTLLIGNGGPDRRYELWFGWMPQWLAFVILLLLPVAFWLLVQWAVWTVLRRVTRGEGRTPTRRLVERTATPARALAGVIGLWGGVLLSAEREVAPGWVERVWPQTGLVLIILAVTWVVIGLIGGMSQMILARYRVDVRDNLQARRMHTQVRVISRTMQVIAGLIGIGIALLTFEFLAQIGTSLLASAGIAGIVVGFAAQPVLGNLIAGLQIALTQPIRLDDAVVIEGEWGWIEEITATYVVVRIWDQRRLIVPFRKIIEEPFQNWTRTRADILGAVMLYVDYTCPIEPLRAELDRILDGHPKWDGRAKVLQVIEATERVLQLRVLVSAADSPTAWELRCDVRERLIAFLQQNYPQGLPRARAVLFEREQPCEVEPSEGGAGMRPVDDPTFDDAPRAPRTSPEDLEGAPAPTGAERA